MMAIMVYTDIGMNGHMRGGYKLRLDLYNAEGILLRSRERSHLPDVGVWVHGLIQGVEITLLHSSHMQQLGWGKAVWHRLQSCTRPRLWRWRGMDRENSMGYMIKLATVEQLLEVFIFWWKGTPDDAMILVVDRCKPKQYINRMRTMTNTAVWWWRRALGTRSL